MNTIKINVTDIANMLKLYERNSAGDWQIESTGARMQIASDILDALTNEGSAKYDCDQTYIVNEDTMDWLRTWATAQNAIEAARKDIIDDKGELSEDDQIAICELQKRANEGDTVDDISDDLTALRGASSKVYQLTIDGALVAETSTDSEHAGMELIYKALNDYMATASSSVYSKDVIIDVDGSTVESFEIEYDFDAKKWVKSNG